MRWSREKYYIRILSKMLWWWIARIINKYSSLMSKENNIKEKFKIALASTEKVISDDYLKKSLAKPIVLPYPEAKITVLSLIVSSDSFNDA